MNGMSNTNKLLLGFVIVLVVALLALLVGREWFGTPSYYAVYLTTGDLYFGELTRFPQFGLKNVYLLQVNRDNAQNPVSVQRFAEIFWGPEDFLKINRDEIVWTTRLDKNSQLGAFMSNYKKGTSAPTSPQTTTQPVTKESVTTPSAAEEKSQ